MTAHEPGDGNGDRTRHRRGKAHHIGELFAVDITAFFLFQLHYAQYDDAAAEGHRADLKEEKEKFQKAHILHSRFLLIDFSPDLIRSSADELLSALSDISGL